MGDVLVRMEGIEKSFPGVHALSECQFELRLGRGSRPGRRERRGQVHLDEGAGRGLSQRRGAHPLQGAGSRDPQPTRRARPGHQHDPPGTQPDAAPDGGPEHLHRPRAAQGPPLLARRGPAQPPGRAAFRLDAPAHGPDRQGRQTLGCQAADGGDRQGVFPQRRSAHHGRAHGGAHRGGDRGVVPHHPPVPRPRRRHRSTSHTGWKSCPSSRTASPSCATVATSAPARWRRPPRTRSSA